MLWWQELVLESVNLINNPNKSTALTAILQELFFIHFSPFLSCCNPGYSPVKGSAKLAIESTYPHVHLQLRAVVVWPLILSLCYNSVSKCLISEFNNRHPIVIRYLWSTYKSLTQLCDCRSCGSVRQDKSNSYFFHTHKAESWTVLSLVLLAVQSPSTNVKNVFFLTRVCIIDKSTLWITRLKAKINDRQNSPSGTCFETQTVDPDSNEGTELQ